MYSDPTASNKNRTFLFEPSHLIRVRPYLVYGKLHVKLSAFIIFENTTLKAIATGWGK